MDNETSHKVENFIRSQQTHLQYTPPNIHCTNLAECTILIWKNHFLAGIAGLPKSFPIANWCRLTTQCDTTLNMLHPCRQNPLLSAHEALEGSFSFDATPMAPLGTEVLIHMKPNRRSTWGYHTSKASHLSHSTNHYRCIRVSMTDTSNEHITDTFQFYHHAIPVTTITATDRILHATAHLTAVITGVQEAPPDKLTAIQALRTLLLGKVPPAEPTTPQVSAPRPFHDKEPVFIWSPDQVQQPTRNNGTNSPTSVPALVTTLDTIEEDSNDESLPPTLLQCSPRTHATSSPTTTLARLNLRTAHMINCVIAEHILVEAQMPPPTTRVPTCRQGYAFAAHLLHTKQLRSAVNASEHFIGTVIDDTTGDVLEYQHLIKSDKYRKVWEHSSANKLG